MIMCRKPAEIPSHHHSHDPPTPWIFLTLIGLPPILVVWESAQWEQPPAIIEEPNEKREAVQRTKVCVVLCVDALVCEERVSSKKTEIEGKGKRHRFDISFMLDQNSLLFCHLLFHVLHLLLLPHYYSLCSCFLTLSCVSSPLCQWRCALAEQWESMTSSLLFSCKLTSVCSGITVPESMTRGRVTRIIMFLCFFIFKIITKNVNKHIPYHVRELAGWASGRTWANTMLDCPYYHIKTKKQVSFMLSAFCVLNGI